ncbi:hypothetical protein NL676_038058 [Syzygium grande]|nr:hypothetical protein NL676_038058 [Syzygium grande]
MPPIAAGGEAPEKAETAAAAAAAMCARASGGGDWGSNDYSINYFSNSGMKNLFHLRFFTQFLIQGLSNGVQAQRLSLVRETHSLSHSPLLAASKRLLSGDSLPPAAHSCPAADSLREVKLMYQDNMSMEVEGYDETSPIMELESSSHEEKFELDMDCLHKEIIIGK